MGWVTPELKAILVEHGAQFFASKGEDREKVVDDVVALLREAKDDLPEVLSTKVKTWYNNEINLFRNPQERDVDDTRVKIKRHNAKSVAKEVYGEKYEEIKQQLQDSGTEWNDLYRETMKRLWGGLTDKQQTKCQETATSRNSGDVSEGEKRKLATANANKEVASFVKRMHDIYGVRMLCLTSWTDPTGNSQTSVHETSTSPKFSQQFPNWKTQKNVANSFLEYSEFFNDPVDSDEEEQEEVAKKMKYPWARLDFHPEDDEETTPNWRGYPILPDPPNKKNSEWIGGYKIVIRAFVKAVYKLQIGSSHPPWSSMSTPEGAQELIRDKFLPDGLGLKDPSRMVKSEVEAFQKLWMGRQNRDKRPLDFKEFEAKRKAAEAREVRIASLTSKKRRYVEIAAGSDDDDDGTPQADKGPSKKKTKPAAASTSAVNTNEKAGKKTAKSAEKPARPLPRPVLKPDTREEILLGLSTLASYRLLVKTVLKSATKDTTVAKKKGRTPSWISWDTDAVKPGPEFFADETPGYLSHWKAILQWISENPHIPNVGSSFTHSEASDVLLIVGLTLRTCKECAEAEPDTPLYNVPFGMEDKEETDQAVANMLAALTPKKALKFGVSAAVHRPIENTWKKVCLEVGLSEDDIKTFGEAWKAFTEAYAAADCALMRSGKPPQSSPNAALPVALKTWVETGDASGDYPVGDQTEWQTEIARVWGQIQNNINAAIASKNVDNILDEDWCRRGRGGIVCLVLGMKWWRISILTTPDNDSFEAWSTALEEMTAAFKVIVGAESLKRPRSRRGKAGQ